MSRLERDADYEWAITLAKQKNLEDLRKNITRSDYMKKFKNFAYNQGYTIKEVIEKVANDEMFAKTFLKDPQKQSIHEKTAANFIKDNKHVINFKKLPASGANALFLHEGEIISKREHDRLKLTSKSLDFYWEVKVDNEVLKFYATHKYTNEGGGAQDHQYNEIISFLNNANQVKKSNIFFLAISDGNYYTNPYKGTTKLEYLKEHFSGQRTEAIAIKELDGLIEREIFKLRLKSPFLNDVNESATETTETRSKRKIKVK